MMNHAISKRYSDFLKKENFFHDVGSIMDICPANHGYVHLPEMRPYASDKEALSADWQRVGADMWRAIGRVENERKG